MRCVLGTRPPVMCTKYCDYLLAALRGRYCNCCAMSLWHQVCPELCIVYCVPGIRSVVYWVLGLSYIVLGHWVLGPHTLDATSSATALHTYNCINVHTRQRKTNTFFAKIMSNCNHATWKYN